MENSVSKSSKLGQRHPQPASCAARGGWRHAKAAERIKGMNRGNSRNTFRNCSSVCPLHVQAVRCTAHLCCHVMGWYVQHCDAWKPCIIIIIISMHYAEFQVHRFVMGRGRTTIATRSATAPLPHVCPPHPWWVYKGGKDVEVQPFHHPKTPLPGMPRTPFARFGWCLPHQEGITLQLH